MDNAVHVKVEVVNCGIVLLYLFRKRFRLLPLLKQSVPKCDQLYT